MPDTPPRRRPASLAEALRNRGDRELDQLLRKLDEDGTLTGLELPSELRDALVARAAKLRQRR